MSDYIDTTNSSLKKIPTSSQMAKSSSVEAVGEYADIVIASNTAKRDTFLAKLFPDPVQRAAKMGELEIVKTEFEFRKKALVMVRETHSQALRETCNQYLIRGKADSRAETAAFLMRKEQELQEELNNIFDRFIASVEKKTQRLATIINGTLQRALEQDLDKEIHNFVDMKDKLVKKFRQIVDEGV
ncbi:MULTISPECIES: hypothetical protein [Calothrix]|uniref:Uncharacterized protein n=2 Tax=Calothrix TaxID=1186 RepID=A0ABR8AJF3_9CYAN|nr:MULTISPECIES: hypothetical protein [Calothrix]MBD2200180.1 hypothetical protein [Calothrix parietina FACHB-288]MBD2229165.1 hypothetical protein [Calothrix anomala FACHB-343]